MKCINIGICIWIINWNRELLPTQVLFNSRYTSIELRKGTIEYFRGCLEKQDPEAITSYKHELHKESLIEMHNIHDPEVYLQKMSISASSNLPIETRGLWGDIFCIHWVSNWLIVPIRVWSKTQAWCYLHFNSTIGTNTFDILFHDENPINGHFEPLLHKENNNMFSCSTKQVKCSLEHVSVEHRINERSIPIRDTLENHFKPHRKQLSLHCLKKIARSSCKLQQLKAKTTKSTINQQTDFLTVKINNDTHQEIGKKIPYKVKKTIFFLSIKKIAMLQ